MSNPVKDLENAFKLLSEDQLQNFRAWFERFDAKKWDEKIERDCASGKLDSLINKAIAEHKHGKTRQLWSIPQVLEVSKIDQGKIERETQNSITLEIRNLKPSTKARRQRQFDPDKKPR